MKSDIRLKSMKFKPNYGGSNIILNFEVIVHHRNKIDLNKLCDIMHKDLEKKVNKLILQSSKDVKE